MGVGAEIGTVANGEQLVDFDHCFGGVFESIR
jgi:hypothetical protein